MMPERIETSPWTLSERYRRRRFWWVNQRQTRRHEIAGGYLWSPKRKNNGARNQFYENMREVSPGDLVFSYWNGSIRAWGTAQSYAYDAPRPAEYGGAASNWSRIGYKVNVRFEMLARPVAPKTKKYWPQIQPLLPSNYSPLSRVTGNGLQPVYLAALEQPLGSLLVSILNADGSQIEPMPVEESCEDADRQHWEDAAADNLARAPELDETMHKAIIMARRGQGRFRENVRCVEKGCRVTGIAHAEYLVASHIKPWRHSDNCERLDGHNGLLLAPHVDFLFDRGFISFEDDGQTLVSPVLDEGVAESLGIDAHAPPNVGSFTSQQCEYLRFHRDEILRRVRPG